MYTPKKGAIAAGDELTAEAGYEILKAGGNAFDGAVAATLMSFVASSTITSMGGGGFMVSRPSESPPVLFDFFTQTPGAKRKADEIEFFPVIVDFGDKTQEFHVGMGTAAVPGNLAGLYRIYEKYCSLPFMEIAMPAIEAARNGAVLHPQTKYQADILKPILGLSETGKAIYFDNSQIKSPGQRVKLPLYADFLEFIAHEGPREFYEGEIALKITEDCARSGGHLLPDDFKNYRVIETTPLSFNYRDHEIYTTRPPNAGGPLIGFTLSLLDRISLNDIEWGSENHLHYLIKAIGITSEVRKNIFEKNLYDPGVTGKLFNPELYEKMSHDLKSVPGKSGNTTQVSIADERGNFVSITTSVGEGCGYYIPGTHIMLNNMLGEEDLNPAGFHSWIPDQRISSMMAPILIQKDGRPLAVLGSGGSNRIRSALVQAISNYIDFGKDPDNAVNEPRIHWERNQLDVEPGFDFEKIEKIKLPVGAKRIYWTAKNMYFGGVHAVFAEEDGELIPAGDRRRVGAVKTIW